RAGQVVVDGRRHPDHGEAHARQRQRARLRPVAADHDQAVDAPVLQVAQPLGAHLLVPELGHAAAAQERPAALEDAAHVARPQRLDGRLQQAGVAVADAEDLPALVEAGADHAADRGVHARGVPAAGEHGDALHRRRRPWVDRLPGAMFCAPSYTTDGGRATKGIWGTLSRYMPSKTRTAARVGATGRAGAAGAGDNAGKPPKPVEKNYITPAGHRKLAQEFDFLRGKKRPE